ncbi:MAG: TraB/GumN family protein [Acidobacteria bacterium]|nr:TraB/GumN family protein [Acidobacteriota bacterium]
MTFRNYRHVLLLLLLVTLPLSQAGEPRLFLWEIEGETTSYMFGTIHLPDERVLTLPAPVRSAFSASDAVYTEIAMDAVTQLKFSAATLLPKGESLRALLGPDLARRATAYVESRERDMELFDRFTIWAFMLQLTLLDDYEKYLSAVPMDYSLYQQAIADGKQAAGLETLEEQMSLFTDLPTPDQAELLSQTLNYLESLQGRSESPTEKIVQIYLSGDLAALSEEIFASTDMDTEVSRRFMDSLLKQRNLRMADRMAALLQGQPGTTFFFAVGAAHFIGEDRLPTLMRQRGFRVHRQAARAQRSPVALP